MLIGESSDKMSDENRIISDCFVFSTASFVMYVCACHALELRNFGMKEVYLLGKIGFACNFQYVII